MSQTVRSVRGKCQACEKALGAGSKQDEAGNWLCIQCVNALKSLADEQFPAELSEEPVVVPPLRQAPVAYAPAARTVQPATLQDFIDFRWMITPFLIRAAFVVVTFGCLLLGVAVLWRTWVNELGMDRRVGTSLGFSIIVLGPIAYRVIAECLIVLFRIHESLTSIDNKTRED